MSGFDPSSLLQGTSFEPNAILRGAQLTLVGANRALQNPGLFTSEHYRQAALAVAAGIGIRILIAIPTLGIRGSLKFAGLFTDLSHSTWDEDVVEGIEYIEHHVLQIPFFLMSFMRYLSPAMDHMFMDSLAWVDQTYISKHRGENPDDLRAMYHPNLKQYDEIHAEKDKIKDGRKKPYDAMILFLWRYGRKAALSLAVYLLTFLPYVGHFVLPAASFYTFNNAVGTPAALVIFSSGIVLPKKYLIMFLQSYFSSRSLMRELLEPYFSRIQYSKQQKKQWFHDRAGVLYGFAIAFFILVKIPLVGVLVYGIAEASTAYLITKITEPPPPPSDAKEFKERDVHWENKQKFLNLPLDKLDKFNMAARNKEEARPDATGAAEKGRQFT
ncbi:hypothetical protein LTR37_017687 [Vermiconidia calcicola]|uniref:Uncharacterized protein n=1 Tax=Vermiconidia calcicola TaxID=1690605 RepID=A0ACC3MJE9_9PEZI|nr:hypothetical protein LTR37_017687 [Vermiconidia calcicola]